MKYVYPAIFYCAIEGGYYVEFPDVEGAVTSGETLYEAIEMAEDILAMSLADYENFKAGKYDTTPDGNEIKVMNNRIVEPTPIKEIVAEPDEYSTDAFVVLIRADTDLYRLLCAEMEMLY